MQESFSGCNNKIMVYDIKQLFLLAVIIEKLLYYNFTKYTFFLIDMKPDINVNIFKNNTNMVTFHHWTNIW